MIEKRKRSSYNNVFKQDAIERVVEQQHSCSEVAKQLGVAVSNVTRWVRQYRRDQQDLSVGGIQRRALEAEAYTLKKKNKRLEMEREILKKAAAFFVRALNYVTSLSGEKRRPIPSQPCER